MVDTFEQHTFAAELECRYFLHVPQNLGTGALLVLTLHGYGSNPRAMLHLTSGLIGVEHTIAALQAPNEHYLSQGPPGPNPTTGYNWGVRDHWAAAARLHHEMVLAALSILRRRFDVPASQCLLVGFSQAVGLNYRFMGTHPGQVGGLIGICGGVPRDWEEDKYRTIASPILHISREEDEYYPAATSRQFPERLRKHATDVEFHMLPGGHRFPSKAGHIVRPWLERVFGLEQRS